MSAPSAPPNPLARPCPFCAATVEGPRCPKCGRDPTAARRVCSACKKMTPSAEAACCHCGVRKGSEMAWKIPLIIAIFVVAIILSIVVQLAR